MDAPIDSRFSAKAFPGVTLVEVMIAMTLIAIVMGSAFAALRPALLASENSRLNVTANEMIMAETEWLRAQHWPAINEIEDGSTFATPVSDSRFLTARYVAEREGREDQIQVVLEITWTDMAGKLQTARVVTFVTKHGVSA
ncbi:MAG: type IV pilus modification PilV family protein [Puniceicoccales bacterium]